MAALPDFVVIGAPRSGTTWLHKHLDEHPDVLMSATKEPRYLAIEDDAVPRFTGPGDDVWMSGLVTSRAAYEALFEDAGDRAAGEASTDYLYRGAVAAPKLHALVPDVRLVAILRNPVQRAYSAWRLLVHSGFEPLTFEQGLAAEEQRIADGWAWWWHFSQHGFYARNLRPWLDAFDRDQLLVVRYDDIAAAPQRVLDRVTDHIGVAAMQGSGLDQRVNEAPLTRAVRKSARQTPLRSILKRIVPDAAWRAARGTIDRATLYKPPVGDEARSRLEQAYAADARQLEELLDERLQLVS